MRSLLIDTNILLLFVVGMTDRSYIAKHKCLKGYDEDSFDLLKSFLQEGVNELVTTPNVITETSNLARQIYDPARTEIMLTLKSLIGSMAEHYVESRKATEPPEFIRLGLTDAALLTKCAEDMPLLTDDLDLYLAWTSAGHEAYKFTHLRTAAGLLP